MTDTPPPFYITEPFCIWIHCLSFACLRKCCQSDSCKPHQSSSPLCLTKYLTASHNKARRVILKNAKTGVSFLSALNLESCWIMTGHVTVINTKDGISSIDNVDRCWEHRLISMLDYFNGLLFIVGEMTVFIGLILTNLFLSSHGRMFQDMFYYDNLRWDYDTIAVRPLWNTVRSNKCQDREGNLKLKPEIKNENSKFCRQTMKWYLIV